MDIISVHYRDIRKLFTTRASQCGDKFNEDAFNDAFISCAQHFKNMEIEYDCAVKYFWIVYKNTVNNQLSKQSKTVICDEFEDIIDEDDNNEFAKYVYDTVMNAITESFGEEDMYIYSLYKYNSWTKQDLIDAGYNCKNFDIRIKNIHRFVKEYIKLKYKNK